MHNRETIYLLELVDESTYNSSLKLGFVEYEESAQEICAKINQLFSKLKNRNKELSKIVFEENPVCLNRKEGIQHERKVFEDLCEQWQKKWLNKKAELFSLKEVKIDQYRLPNSIQDLIFRQIKKFLESASYDFYLLDCHYDGIKNLCATS